LSSLSSNLYLRISFRDSS